MTKDWDSLKISSIAVRTRINEQPEVLEDTLTQNLLFEISRIIQRIIYIPFNRKVEGRFTGADWEWWFLFRNVSYKFRVQAKKVKTNSRDNYPSLAYPRNTCRQINILINDSILNNAIPVYALYTNMIKQVKCKKTILNEGVYISSAIGLNEKFLQVPRQRILYDILLEDSIPLSCMFCCPLIRNITPNYPFIDFIKEYFNSGILGNNSNQILGQWNEIPDYVQSFINYSKSYSSDWLNQFENDLLNINGILIFDNRDK